MWVTTLLGVAMLGVLSIDGADVTTTPGAPPADLPHPNVDLLNNDICGQAPLRSSGPLFQVPWMALLVYNTSRGVVYSCGGTLINERYVLTAAHCVRSLPKYTKLIGVRLGEFDYTEAVDCQQVEGKSVCADPPLDVGIEKVIAHRGYTQKSFRNNIALLRLNHTANFTSPSVRPICLPVSPEERKRWFHEGELLTVLGWGTTSTGVQSPVVRPVHVEYVTTDDCAAAYRNYTKRIEIYDDQFCLRGTKNGDATSGDGGGPLVAGGFESLDRVVQYGIVSFGPSSGVLTPPGVYTRVGSYVKWILDNIEVGDATPER